MRNKQSWLALLGLMLIVHPLGAQTISTGPLGAVGPASGDLTGNYPNPTIALGSVNNSKLSVAPPISVKGNPSGTTGVVQDIIMPSCTGGTTLNFQVGNGFYCEVAGGVAYPKSNFESLPPASGNKGQVYEVLNLGPNHSLWSSNGTYWVPMTEVILCEDVVPHQITGTVVEVTVTTCPLPANALSPGVSLKAEVLAGNSGSNTNQKSLKVRLGNTTFGLANATSASAATNVINATLYSLTPASQISTALNTTPTTSTPNNPLVNFNVDTTKATSVIVTGSVTNAGDVVTIYYTRIVLRP